MYQILFFQHNSKFQTGEGGNFTSPPPQNEPLKNPPRLGLREVFIKIESNDKLKEIDIKTRTCYYFDDITETKDFDLDNIVVDEKSYENILVPDISYKSLIDSKLLLIRLEIYLNHKFQ